MAQLKQTVGNSTVNRFHALISSIYKFAVHAGRIAINPAKNVKRYKENESRIRWLRQGEEMAVRKQFVANAHEWEFDLALNTGMRRGEQFFLEWKNVDFENKVLIVKGKTGRRDVVLNSDAVAALLKLKTITVGNKYVCPDARDGMKRDSRRWLEDALERAVVQDFHWHDLRHTFASRLIMKGVDIRTVQTLMGHKSITMTMKYAHLAQDHRQAAVEKMNQAVTA
jgi:integrase